MDTLLHHLMLVGSLIVLLRRHSEVNSQVLIGLLLRLFHHFLLGRLLLLDILALGLHLRDRLLVLLSWSLGLDLLLLHLIEVILSLHVLLHLGVHLLHHHHHLLVFSFRFICDNLHGTILVVNTAFTGLLQMVFRTTHVRWLLLDRALTACQENLLGLLNFALDCLRLRAWLLLDLFGDDNDFLHYLLGMLLLWLNCLLGHFLYLLLFLR